MRDQDVVDAVDDLRDILDGLTMHQAIRKGAQDGVGQEDSLVQLDADRGVPQERDAVRSHHARPPSTVA